MRKILTRSYGSRRILALCCLTGLFLIGPARLWADASPDRVVLGNSRLTPRATLELRLRDRVRAFLDPAADAKTLLPLFALAGVYGIVHALGPGHQKTLLGGYFLGEGGGAGKAALASIITSLLHASSVLVIFGGLAMAARTLADTERTRILMTKGAGYALLALSVGMAIQRVLRAVRRLRESDTANARVLDALPASRLANHGEGCDCPACRAMERRQSQGAPFWSVLLAGGLVPCPGAAFFLLVGVSGGNPRAGILAVLAISAGMALTLFIITLGASAAHTAVIRASSRSARGRSIAQSAVEIAGAAIMVAFAAVLVL